MAEKASHLAAIRRAVMEALRVPDYDRLVIDYVVAIVVSNAWSPDADPLWGWINGPPGSFKTELARTLADHERIHYLSSFSESALVSGYDPGRDGGSQDQSLIRLLPDKTLVLQDFTSVLGQSDRTLKKIFGDLRACYDGTYRKHFGSVGDRCYKAKFGIIACVTPAIDRVAAQHVILGERFITFRVCRNLRRDPKARFALLRHAQQAMSDKARWRLELKTTMQSRIDEIVKHLPSDITINDEYREQIVQLCDVIANARCLPSILLEGSKYPDFEPEIATRLVNQFTNLALAHCAADARTSLSEADLVLIRRVARDTLPPFALKTLTALHNAPDWCHINRLSKQTGIPIKQLRPVLDQYASEALVSCRSATSRQGYSGAEAAEWRLTDAFRTQVRTSRLFA